MQIHWTCSYIPERKNKTNLLETSWLFGKYLKRGNGGGVTESYNQAFWLVKQRVDLMAALPNGTELLKRRAQWVQVYLNCKTQNRRITRRHSNRMHMGKRRRWIFKGDGRAPHANWRQLKPTLRFILLWAGKYERIEVKKDYICKLKRAHKVKIGRAFNGYAQE